MSKQIYIDSNGNEIQVSGTVNTADMLPVEAGSSKMTSEAIGDLSTLTTTVTSSLVGAVNELNTNKQNNMACGSTTADLNTLTKNGVYWINNGATHTPTGAYGYLIVSASSDGVRVQRYILTSFEEYIRYYVNNNWSGWRKLTPSYKEYTVQLGTSLWNGVYYAEKNVSSDVSNYGEILSAIVIDESDQSTFSTNTNRACFCQVIPTNIVRVYSPQASNASGHYVKIRVSFSANAVKKT